MKKTVFALATAATLAIGTLSAPTTADARCYGCAVGAGVAAGVIGGAIIGGAIANSGPGPGYYGPEPGSGTKAMARPIRPLCGSRAGQPRATATATSSAGGSRVSPALKDHVTTRADDRRRTIG